MGEEPSTGGTVSATITEFAHRGVPQVTLKDRDTAIPLDEFVVRVVSGDIIAVTRTRWADVHERQRSACSPNSGTRSGRPTTRQRSGTPTGFATAMVTSGRSCRNLLLPPVDTPPVIDVRGRQG